MLKVGETKELKIMLLNDSGNPTSGTISYVVYDENDASFTTGDMTSVTGVTGLYTMSFTPDIAGVWSVVFRCANPSRTAVKCFDVGLGVEQDIYDAVVALNDISVANVWSAANRSLSTPNNYKADVSALALEATLTAIKGSGWSTETLKVIKDAIDAIVSGATAAQVWGYGTRTLTDPNSYKADVSALALEATLGTHDTDIKTLLSTIQTDLDSPNQYKADVSSLALEATLGTHDSDIKTLLTAVQADLDSPNQYKANVASLALEATLTSIKGGGWTTETLKAIYDAIGSLNNLAQSDILSDATAFDGADIATILSAIQNGTYGLSALETLVDEIESLLKNVTYGLNALKTEIDANETKIDDVDSDLVTHATALGTHDTDIKAILEDATHGLAALETLVDDIESDLPADPASQARIISKMDFWSEGVVTVNIPDTADSDIDLPDVVVPTLPTGITIFRVELLFKCAMIKDTSIADNAIDETGVIRIKKDGDAAFDGNGVDAYIIEDNKWSIDVSEATERGGDAFVGKTDIKAKVDGADTYELRLDSVSADGANLVLVDVCVGLRIYFY